MKIALLSGADKNAGDYLIVHRSRQLLLHLIDNCELVEFPRNKPLDSQIDKINDCQVIVFAGGPGYVSDMYPGRFPLVKNLTAIKPPMFALGMGCFTPSADIKGISFSGDTRLLLDRIESDGFCFGCRDRLSQQVLNANGYSSAVLTGCPAWYDLSKVGTDHLLTQPQASQVRSIAISDPALLRNSEAPKQLICELRKVFPHADFKLVFHRGWFQDEFTSRDLARAQMQLVNWATDNKVEAIDISYSHKGFSVYDECDLHVGYRVHAHLYNVSQRKPSFLIEEDGRGFGANDALGCTNHVSLDRPTFMHRALSAVFRKAGSTFSIASKDLKGSVVRMVDHVVKEIESGYPEANKACMVASRSFLDMQAHVLQLNQSFFECRSASYLHRGESTWE